MQSTDTHQVPPRARPEDEAPGPRRWVVYAAAVLGLLVVQAAFSGAGNVVARRVDAAHLDPGGWWVALSVHHVVQGALALAVLLALSRFAGLDVGLRVGDVRLGVRAVGLVTSVLAVYLLAFYAGTHALGIEVGTPVAVPSEATARAGYAGFQLLLSGPSEELLFRALPVTVLAAVAPVVLVRRWHLSREVVVAAALFSFAHGVVSGGTVVADPAQLVFAFVLGVVQGVTFQRTRSVLYPMAIHSIANVLVTTAAMAATASTP